MEKRFLIGILFITGFFTMSLALFSYVNLFYEPSTSVEMVAQEPSSPTQEQPAILQDNGDNTLPEPAPGPQTYFINLFDASAEPAMVNIKPGDTVVWINKGTSRRRFWINEVIYSDQIEPTQSYSYVFEKTGTYRFRDVYNGNVVGNVYVKGESVAKITGNLLSRVPQRFRNLLVLQLSMLAIGMVLLFYPYKKK